MRWEVSVLLLSLLLTLTIDCTVWLCKRVCLPTCLFAAVHESRVNWQLLLCVGEHKDYFRANFWIFLLLFLLAPCVHIHSLPHAAMPTQQKKREQYPVPDIGADPLLSHFNTFFSFPFLFSFQGVRRGDSEDMVRLR